MIRINKIKILDILRQKISFSLYFSFLYFTACWFLDFYITNINSHGDFTQEANVIARYIWQIIGRFRFIEFPIWIAVVFIMMLIINTKSKFLALLWVNFLAFQHLLGFITWLPYQTLNFLYALPEWAIGYGISLISILLSLFVTFLVTRKKYYSSSNVVH
jgi:hypothetical protein